MERYCPRCFRRFESRVDKCPDDGSNLVVTEDRNLVGEELDGRYRVLERIGSGGMGVVYKAEQLLVKRIVALKVLRREVVREGSAVKRFLNEAQVIAALNNPHTVTLHDFGVTGDGLLYYTMELLRGRPLSRVIRQDGPLAVERATRLALQVCDSLEEAHERGILHRDLKPDNLFVQERKGLEELKVLDFGVAKLMGASGAKAVTGTGMIVGTPLYLSPEQALGDELGPSSDLYSLGIVLYEMLVGLPPFMGETPMQTILARLNKPVPPTAARNPSVRVPRRLEEFLSKALEKDPKRRFQTAAEFREALRTALDSGKQPVDAVLLPPLASSQGLTRVKTGEWEGPTSYADEAETTAQQSPASDPDAETHPASGASASRQALAPAVSPDEDKGQKSVSADSSEQSDSWGNGPGLEELGKKSVRRRLLLPVGAVLLLGLVGGFWHMYGPQSVSPPGDTPSDRRQAFSDESSAPSQRASSTTVHDSFVSPPEGADRGGRTPQSEDVEPTRASTVRLEDATVIPEQSNGPTAPGDGRTQPMSDVTEQPPEGGVLDGKAGRTSSDTRDGGATAEATSSPPQATCGNGSCDPSETCADCNSDCGTCDVGWSWKSVPAGTFTMGCGPDDQDCRLPERPAHAMAVLPFFLLTTEVTEEQFRAVMSASPSCCENAGDPRMPVECVAWSQARDFCERIGGRLPTEAEWEYAARAGTTSPHACGYSLSCLEEQAWFASNASNGKHRVGGKLPNAWGLFDMAGNVAEWVQDPWHEDYSGAPSQSFPAWTTGKDTDLVVRGGSFYDMPPFVRTACRQGSAPDVRDRTVGFRCARSGSESEPGVLPR